MRSYYDSSILLAALLNQAGKEALVACWDRDLDRVSSVFLEAECVTVLRRASAIQRPGTAERFLADRLALLDRYLEAITLKDVDAEVMAWLRGEPRLDRCRTLDAIHLATVLLLQSQSDEPLTLWSLDDRLRTAARDLGLRVAP